MRRLPYKVFGLTHSIAKNVILLCGFTLVLIPGHGRTDVDLTDYELVFADEFNSSSIESSKWASALSWGPYFSVNSEQQLYVDSLGMHRDVSQTPFQLTGQSLNITATEKSERNPVPVKPRVDSVLWNQYPQYRHSLQDDNADANYLSGVLTSHNSFTFTHGYIETRAKPAAGRGFLSSIRLMNSQFTENAPEIGVLEHLGHIKNGIYHSFNYLHDVQSPSSTSIPRFETIGVDFTADFHRFGLSWTPQNLSWYIDGREVKRLDTDEAAKFADQTMYLVASLAVGGEWSGMPDNQTQFPASFEIDYIRVYQQKPQRTITHGSPSAVMPTIESPLTTTALSPGPTTFTWTKNSTEVQGWWVFLGNNAFGHDIYKSGRLDKEINEQTVAIPENIGKVHLTLFYLSDNRWNPIQSEYQVDALEHTQSDSTPISTPRSAAITQQEIRNTDVVELTSPELSAAISENTPLEQKSSRADLTGSIDGQQFIIGWALSGVAVKNWWLQLHQQIGGTLLFDSGRIDKKVSNVSINVSRLPTHFYATLHYLVDGVWITGEPQLMQIN